MVGIICTNLHKILLARNPVVNESLGFCNVTVLSVSKMHTCFCNRDYLRIKDIILTLDPVVFVAYAEEKLEA